MDHMTEKEYMAEIGLIHKKIRSVIRRQRLAPRRSRDFAYELAALMALPVCSKLNDHAIELKVLMLAGELELPIKHRQSRTTWRELRRLAGRLGLEPDIS